MDRRHAAAAAAVLAGLLAAIAVLALPLPVPGSGDPAARVPADGGEPPPVPGLGGPATEREQIMEKVGEKMRGLAQKDRDGVERGIEHTAEEYGIPYNMVFEDGGRLVVGIDARKAIEFGKRYTADEVKEDLGTTADIEVRYYVFEREAAARSGEAAGGAASTATGRGVASAGGG